MQFQIETLAPWMPETEAADLINNLLRLDLRCRRLSAKEAGKRIQLTNKERERLKVWPIAPVDMTAADLASDAEKTQTSQNGRRPTPSLPGKRQNEVTALESEWREPFNLVSPHETSPSATRPNYQRNNLSHPPKGLQWGACVCVGNNPETREQAERPDRPPPSSTADRPVSRRGRAPRS